MSTPNTVTAGASSSAARDKLSRNMLMRLGVCVAVCVAIGLVFEGYSSRDETRFLSPEDGVNWIVYPTTPSSIAYPVADQTTVFVVTVPLSKKPRNAVLNLRAFHKATIRINRSQQPLSLADSSQWKDAVEFDLTSMLESGDNTISIDVTNNKGPPALWAFIEIDGRRISTDSKWRCSLLGATETNAIAADVRLPLRAGHLMAYPEEMWTSLISQARLVLIVAAVWVIAIAINDRARHRSFKLYEFLKRLCRYAVILPALIWIVIGVQNLRSLNFPFGHDVEDHVEYIRYVQEQRRIPVASDGWEMHQPPVYYVLMAGLLEVCGDKSSLTWNVGVLRIAGLFTGIVLLTITSRCMNKLFPKQPLAAFFGICIATSIPLSIIQAHAISNDLLAATLFSGAILYALHLTDNPSLKNSVGLGLIVGLAILTKLTVLPPAGALFIALAIRVVQKQSFSVQGMKLLGLPLVTAFCVCGWYFIRNYMVFGQLIVGNFDEVSGFRWWQDPGYFTPSTLTRFGIGIETPFSAPLTSSVPDGLYSTLWGDSGRDVFHRPPWNYELMAVACAFAVVPSVAVIGGIVATLIQWCRRGDFQSLLLLGVFAASSVACAYYILRLPYYSCVKSLFALPCIIPTCVFAAKGLDWFAGLSRFLRIPVLVLIGCWATVSLLSLVVAHTDPQTSNYRCREWIANGDAASAKSIANERLHRNPDDHDAWAIVGFSSQQGSDDAVQSFQRSMLSESIDCNAYQELAVLLENRGRFLEAIPLMEKVIQNSPDWPRSYRCYAACVRRSGGDIDEAIRIARDGLRVNPVDSDLHEEIGRLELLHGNPASALTHFEYALRFNPQSVPSLLAKPGFRLLRKTHR